MDAIGLFTNILHEEGMAEITTSLDKRINKKVPTEFIMELMEIFLYQNIFEFHDGYYKQQKNGAAMGSRPITPYTNNVMAKIDKLKKCRKGKRS